MTHLSAEDLAAYLDDTLAPETRRAVEAHLADCADCRADMLETRRILRTDDGGSPPVRLLAPLAAAAVLATLFLWPNGDPGSSPQLRNDDTATAQETLAGIPVREAEVRTGADSDVVTLAWESIGPRLDYRITVVDAAGETVWTGTSTDTRVTLPPDVTLRVDSIFYWFVDATLENGEAATSGIQDLRVR